MVFDVEGQEKSEGFNAENTEKDKGKSENEEQGKEKIQIDFCLRGFAVARVFRRGVFAGRDENPRL